MISFTCARRSRLEQAGQRALFALGTILAVGFCSQDAFAIGRIVLEVGELSLPGTSASGLTATLDLTSARKPVAHAHAEEVRVAAPVGTLRNVEVHCTNLVVREPKFGCASGHLAARGGPTKTISMLAAAEYDSVREVTTAQGWDFAVAGGNARFTARLDERGWSTEASAQGLDIPAVRALIAPWLKIPGALDIQGHIDARGGALSRAGSLEASAELRTTALDLTNQEGTIVAEKVAATVSGVARRTKNGFDIEARLEGAAGQALAGPVLLNLGANPLQLTAQGQLAGRTLSLDEIQLIQRDLAAGNARARVALDGAPRLTQAHVEISNLQFPAAYTSFLQIGLAATDFGQLKTTGAARGAIDIADNAVTRIDLQLGNLDMEDTAHKFSMADVSGEVHWAAAGDTPTPSSLSWSRASAYGLLGGPARLDFLAHGAAFALTAPARVPIFDGAVLVNTLAVRRVGDADTELDFDAKIEPISMRLISQAFGWPELSGQLSGSIPGLTYRNRVLSVDGDIVASVFDGTIVARGLKLQNPTGPWPRLFADVTARRLDLSLVTNTFSIGSITGRLDADIENLELFDWSPVAFDARLYSTPADRSRKRISQRAVTSISNIGGGGGAVTAALQSGLLRFFDDFRYDRIGIACKLENEVCLMSGIEPAGAGYYMVRGRGLPRIDIIGNQGRVAWPQLIAQIVSGMQSEVVIRGSRE